MSYSSDGIQEGQNSASVTRRLPVELWEHIFSLITVSEGKYSLTIEYTAVPTIFDANPFTLAQVCYWWREITLGCPRLWAAISVDLSRLPRAARAVVKTFLAYSEPCSLDLRIKSGNLQVFSVAQRKSDQRRKAELWQIISEHFSRCHRLTLDATDLSFLSLPPSQANGGAFENLTSLVIKESSVIDSGDESAWFWAAIKGAHRLTDVTTSLKFSYHQLRYVPTDLTRRLTISQLRAEDLTTFLDEITSFSGLHSLALANISHGASGARARPLTLENLCVLSVGTEDTPVDLTNDRDALSSVVLGSLRLPYLVDLTLRGRVMDEHGWPNPLLQLLRSCSQSLRTFSLTLSYSKIRDTDPSDYLLPPLLSITSRLEEFEFNHVKPSNRFTGIRAYRTIGDRLLSHLLHQLASTGDNFLPQLRKLALCMTDITLDSNMVRNVIQAGQSRGVDGSNTGGSILRELSIVRIQSSHFASSGERYLLSTEETVDISDLKHRGMRFSIEDRVAK